MALPRFYCPARLSADTRVRLPESVARHASQVLRLRAGDQLRVFDGAGGEYGARIATIARDEVTIDVVDRHDVDCEAPVAVTLVQALQAGEKMDLTVQKAVELGVARIVPVSTRRSVVRLAGERAARRVEHWRAVAAAACEQCGRNRLPLVSEIITLEQWLAQPGAPETLRLMLTPGVERRFADLAAPVAGRRIELLIGAEGGLAPDEIERAATAGYVGVRLGPRILRTETAGLAALAVIQCLWGDF
ncbi:MAG: 16S rRNA (uracil(1498)-N(3))-methyltransferase [Propionivibrio sp.]